jgi:hypothetical protein
MVLAAGIVLLLPLVGFAMYLWRLGTRIVREERFPPEGTKVIRDVVVIHGDAARWRGRLAQVLGIALGAAGVIMIVLLWRLLGLLA